MPNTPQKATIYITVLILTLLSPFSAKAEYFRHLTLGDGLSQPSVMAISQDPLGRIWLGTREGINIYDGSRITSYKGWVPSGSDGEKIWIGNEVSAI
ncbi:MAG: histidine kinase, partial [Paramuribaculum sp.]|nr:histidine kinase [Paramuribaculum sp.]